MGVTIHKINLFFENLPDLLRAKRIWVGLFFLFATVFLAFGVKNVVIDESLAAYFHKDDPVKQAYDKFRSIFGGDEYVYIYSVNIWLDYGKKLFMRHNVVPYFLLLPQSVAASDPF